MKDLFREHASQELRNPKFIYDKAGKKRAKTQKEAPEDKDEAIQDGPPSEEREAAQVVAVESSPQITETELEDDIPVPEPSASSSGPDLLCQQVAPTPCRALVFGKGWQGNPDEGLTQVVISQTQFARMFSDMIGVVCLQVDWVLSRSKSR